MDPSVLSLTPHALRVSHDCFLFGLIVTLFLHIVLMHVMLETGITYVI